MRNAAIAAILIMFVVLAGCGMAIHVTHQPQEKGVPIPLGGIPFYTKKVACKHETVWIEQTYMLTLIGTTLDGRKTLFSYSMEITQDGYLSEICNTLKKLIGEQESFNDKDIIDAFDRLTVKKYIPPAIGKDFDFCNPKLTEGHKFILVSNQNEPSVFVDYTDPHYLNARIPWAGSVNPNIGLTTDLTLGTVNVKIEEETFKTILSVLPVKEVLSAAAAATTKEMGEVSKKINFVLKIEPRLYKYTLSTISKKNTELPCNGTMDVLHKVSGVIFSSELITAEEPKKKEDEGNKLKFSGSVDLPK